MSETTIDAPAEEQQPLRGASLQAELQRIARTKAPEHATSSRGFWTRLRRKG